MNLIGIFALERARIDHEAHLGLIGDRCGRASTYAAATALSGVRPAGRIAAMLRLITAQSRLIALTKRARAHYRWKAFTAFTARAEVSTIAW